MQKPTIESLQQEIEQLKHENSILKEVQVTAHTGHWVYDVEAKVTTWSPELEELVSVQKDTDLLSSAALNHIHTDDKELVRKAINKCIDRNRRLDLVYRAVNSDGSIRYVSLKTISKKSPDNRKSFIIGIVHDVTDRYISEKSIKESEHLFRSIFNLSSDMHIILEYVQNQDGEVTDYLIKNINEIYEKRYNADSKNIQGFYFSEKNPDLYQQLVAQLNISAITGEPQLDRVYISSLDTFFDILIYSPLKKHLAISFRDVTLMVESENSLQRSEEKFRQLFSLSKDGIILIDYQKMNILDCNQAISEMFGYIKKELIGISLEKLVSNKEFLQKQIKDENKGLINITAVRKDGEHFQSELRFSFFNWAGKRVFIASIRDITERLKAQQIIVKNERKFRQIFEFSADAILILQNYKIVDFNRKALLLFNFTESETLNQSIWKFSPKRQDEGADSRHAMIEKIQSALLGKTLEFRWTFKKWDDSEFTANVLLKSIAFNEGKYIQVVVRDITEKVKIEKQAQSIEKRWQYALESSKLGVWDWNIETNAMFFSDSFNKMLGYDNDKLDENFSTLENITHPDDISKLYDAIDKVVKENFDGSVEFRLQNKNGSYKWFSGVGSIVAKDQKGKPQRYLGTVEDITRKKLEVNKIDQQEKKLKKAIEIAKIGHWNLDLRTMTFTGAKQTFEILGFNDEKSVSLRSIEKLVHPSDREEFIHIFTSNQRQAIEEAEFRILINNQTRYIHSYNFPVNSKKKVLEKVDGIFQDISQYKKQEVVLRENEQFFREITETNRLSICIIQNDNLVYWNPRFEQLTGYKSKKDLTNQFDHNILYSESSIDDIKKSLKELLDGTHTTLQKEISITNKYKRELHLDAYMSVISFKGHPAVLCTWIDNSKRKKEEIALIKSEKNHRNVSENASAGLALVDQKGIIEYINNYFAHAVGINQTDLNNKLFYEILPKENQGKIFNLFNDVVSGKKDESNFDVVLDNGNLIKTWYKLSIKGITTGQNEAIKAVISLKNIHELKETELTLRDSEYRYKMLFESAQEGISMCDFNGNILYANTPFYQILKVDKEKSKFYSLKNTLYQGKHHRLFELIDKVKQFKKAQEELYIDANKENSEQYLHIHAALLYTQSHTPYGMMLIANDITEKKYDEENLSKSEERFRTMFDSAPLACMLIDKNRSIALANSRVLAMFNMGENEIKEKRIDHLTHTDSLEKLIQSFSELFAGLKDNLSFEVKYQTPENKTLLTSNTVAALKNNLGETQHAFLMVNDITNKKEVEKKILQSEKINALGQLAEGIAHDYNNQLMGIHGNAFLIKNKAKDLEHVSDYAQNIINAVNRSSDITQKLMAFSNKSKLLDIPVNIHSLIQESIVLMKSKIQNINIEENFRASNPILMGDPAKIQNALINIINNSIEAVTSEGKIIISTNLVYFERRQNNHPSLKTLAPGQYLKVDIVDNGKGMSQATLQNIFDPFFTTKSTKKATGLGLPAAQGIINSHKGTITVESQNNIGSTFSIYLPSSSSDFYHIDSPDEQVIIKGMANIMFVDDEEIVRTVTVELLKELGYNVYAFSRGSSAIHFFNKNKENIDLVLLDLIMPEMDGNTVYEQIRRVNPDVKVLILSGYGHSSEVDDLIQDGVSGFIKKPASMAELSQKIAEVLKIAGEESELNISINDNNAIDNLGGNKELFKKILKQFIEKYENILPEIGSDIANNELNKAKITVHSIKSIAGNLGATELQKNSQKLEDLIVAKKMEEIKFQFVIFKEIFRETIVKIKQNKYYSN